jgi:hypothetical protein
MKRVGRRLALPVAVALLLGCESSKTSPVPTQAPSTSRVSTTMPIPATAAKGSAVVRLSIAPKPSRPGVYTVTFRNDLGVPVRPSTYWQLERWIGEWEVTGYGSFVGSTSQMLCPELDPCQTGLVVTTIEPGASIEIELIVASLIPGSYRVRSVGTPTWEEISEVAELPH